MKTSKHIIATVLISGLFASSFAHAQTSTTENSNGLHKIVSSMVFKALKNTTYEIELQLENAKKSASEAFINSDFLSTEKLAENEKSNHKPDLIGEKTSNGIIKERNQTSSDND